MASPIRRIKSSKSENDDDGVAGLGLVSVNSREPASLSMGMRWALAGVGLASASIVTVTLAAKCHQARPPLPLLAAFVSGSLAASAAAILFVVGLRRNALKFVPGLLSVADLLPDESDVWNGQRGGISLVGAGSGSASQLTMEAFRALQTADVVICDRILPAKLHAAVPSSAILYVAEKIPGQADVAQAELCAWGIAALRQGKRVVRLKVG